jgi:hypothetical protein
MDVVDNMKQSLNIGAFKRLKAAFWGLKRRFYDRVEN